MRNGWIYVNLRNKTFRAERGAGRLGRRSGGVMRFFGGGMAEFVRKGRKIKKDAPISARDGTYMIFGESVLGKLAMTFLMAMVPVVELRGAIPYGVAYGMPLWLTYLIAIVGNMLPVPFIYLFARKILLWGKDKPVIGRFFTFCLEKGERGGQKLQAKAGRGLFWALLLFVGIPLPGTGAWTGTLAASLLDMGFKKSVLACMGGVLLAGCIMGILSVLGVSAFGAVVQ